MKLTNNFLIIPTTSIDITQLLIESGRGIDDAKKIIINTGISKITCANLKSLSEYIFTGLKKIMIFSNEIFKNIDAVIIVSQTYDDRIPSISTRVQALLKLKIDTFCIDLMDGCSGYIKSLHLASMLEKNGYKKILIIAGDLNSLMTSKSEIGTKILFGDGVSISILESDESILETRLYNQGDLNNIISCSIENNLINMNGFEVFRFTKNIVPIMINEYLSEKKYSIDKFDLLGLHQASKLVVENICSSLNYSNKLTYNFACGHIGNLGSGSIGAWLSQIHNIENKGDLKMLAVGFGSGLSWGLASITVNCKLNRIIYV